VLPSLNAGRPESSEIYENVTTRKGESNALLLSWEQMKRDKFLRRAIATATILSMPAAATAGQDATEQIRAIEKSSGGRFGVFALDTRNGRNLSHRADERFPMCSTFKFLTVAALLTRVDTRNEQLDRHITFGKSDLLSHAPVTSKHVADGFMIVSALCEAALVYSDNTAANLLLGTVGGPPGVTRYARTLGDSVTTLNRTEPELNTAIPGDFRDTTTPVAMASDMRKILLGDALSAPSRSGLSAWLVACRTGDDLIRAGLPKSWRAGDKTGLGGADNALGDSCTRNDVAILWPPKRPPVIVTAYLTESKVSAAARDSAIAAVGRVVSSALE